MIMFIFAMGFLVGGISGFLIGRAYFDKSEREDK
jgi:hypothetical protein